MTEVEKKKRIYYKVGEPRPPKGRPKKYLTQEESKNAIIEANRRYYENNEEYRERKKEQMRQYYYNKVKALENQCVINYNKL